MEQLPLGILVGLLKGRTEFLQSIIEKPELVPLVEERAMLRSIIDQFATWDTKKSNNAITGLVRRQLMDTGKEHVQIAQELLMLADGKIRTLLRSTNRVKR